MRRVTRTPGRATTEPRRIRGLRRRLCFRRRKVGQERVPVDRGPCEVRRARWRVPLAREGSPHRTAARSGGRVHDRRDRGAHGRRARPPSVRRRPAFRGAARAVGGAPRDARRRALRARTRGDGRGLLVPPRDARSPRASHPDGRGEDARGAVGPADGRNAHDVGASSPRCEARVRPRARRIHERRGPPGADRTSGPRRGARIAPGRASDATTACSGTTPRSGRRVATCIESPTGPASRPGTRRRPDLVGS